MILGSPFLRSVRPQLRALLDSHLEVLVREGVSGPSQRLMKLLKQSLVLFHLVQILLSIQLSVLLGMMVGKSSFHQLLQKMNLGDSMTKSFYKK